MTANSLSRPIPSGPAGTTDPVGVMPARMPPGSAFNAPFLVGNNGDGNDERSK
jgi:hypothetical protein